MTPDREKVIKGLELVKQDIHEIFVSGSQIAVDCLRIDNAIALLKEQDPVPAELEGGGSSWWWVCGECHGQISKGDRYCRHCGHEIKWE